MGEKPCFLSEFFLCFLSQGALLICNNSFVSLFHCIVVPSKVSSRSWCQIWISTQEQIFTVHRFGRYNYKKHRTDLNFFVRDPKMYMQLSLFQKNWFEQRKYLEQIRLYGPLSFWQIPPLFFILSFTMFVWFSLHPKTLVSVANVPKCWLCLLPWWTCEFLIRH